MISNKELNSKNLKGEKTKKQTQKIHRIQMEINSHMKTKKESEQI